ncbi:N-acetylmuramoyl-L-alanine amidase [Streptomyces yunnanensis]|uniref:N-acetylmuramoyl-L-alanine amidase n=1 Tax=Streptomyces yunnanensis TaxID=156453 RepID=A0ABY8A3W4_9ACTN|nr:N-acetylmuramoyl-L-alanine amidase [Streptomyces yunnanensis]WEB38486.1 N-acetylmuramoyl-L-alanine amidase [Streptomyces yunnanensis]
MNRDERALGRRHLVTGLAALAATSACSGSGAPGPGASRAAPGYPQAQWVPASITNFTPADRPASHPVQMVIVHVTQETFPDTLMLFGRPGYRASAHYTLRSQDGFLAQCVQEHDVAWHAGNSTYNWRSIGVEHEGRVDEPRWFTDVLYERSAALTAAICHRYGIPVDRRHIIGHNEVPGADHIDPGPLWDWPRYMRLVAAAF